VLAFNIMSLFDEKQLGLDSMQGRIFTYKLNLTNTKRFVPIKPQPLNDTIAQSTIRYDGGLGMIVSIVRIPSCLQVDFNFLEGLKRNKFVDFYEVKNFNSEIVLYWRQMRPGETKTLSVDLIQRYSGTCLQKPHNAYPYYNNDQPVWIMSARD